MTPTVESARKFGQQKFKEIAVKEVELTVQQSRFWEQTRAKFLSEAPGFCFILYQMMNPRRKQAHAVFTNDDKAIPVAATDGLYCYLNVNTWFKYKLDERVFIVAHEVCHSILNHPITMHMYRMSGRVRFEDGTEAPWVEDVGQRAADYIINDMLVESKIGTKPADACHDKALITHKDSFITAYQKLYRKSNGGKGLGSGSGTGGSGFDVVLKPGTGEGKSATQAKDERNDQEWKTAVAAAMASAKAQGKLSSSMSSMFEEVLEPKVSWQDYIMGFFQRKAGSGSYNFRRPDKRFIVRNPRMFVPARSGNGADVVVVAIDTSGSIGDKTIAMFLGEVAGILEDVRPASLYVMWCDARVHRVDEPEDIGDLREMRRKGAPGRGGTSFVPVFKRVQKMGLRPDAVLYLTDMEGTFPKVAPNYPVLWGSIGTSKAPFGEVVTIPNADKA